MFPARGVLGLGAVILVAGLLVAEPAAAQQTPTAAQVARNLSPATIRMLQHSLIQGGYAVDAADGVWGPKTETAVREFQRAKGMQATGRPDPDTLTALGVTGNAATRPGMQSGAPSADNFPPVRQRTPADLDRATIRAIQQALDKQGLQVGSVDGVWGERTAAAIGNLQRARGMPASGELDAHTLAALGLLPGGADRLPASRSGQALGAADLDPAAIRMIQQSLNQRGFEIGTPDGVWGDKTVRAMRDFQRTQGIEPLGDPDVYTLAALGILPANKTTPTAVRQR